MASNSLEPEFDYWRGKPKMVNSSIKRCISQYTRHYNDVKIGITCRPKKRMYEHFNSGKNWERMVIIYETSSVNFINKIEIEHIKYQKDYIVNQNNGGGGPNGKTGPYYLYVLLKNKI